MEEEKSEARPVSGDQPEESKQSDQSGTPPPAAIPDAGELAFTHLNRALADENPATRHAAVDTLAKLGPDAEPYLQIAMRDQERSVRHRALEAIKALNAAPR